MPFRFENFKLLSVWFSQTDLALAECIEKLLCGVHGYKTLDFIWFLLMTFQILVVWVHRRAANKLWASTVVFHPKTWTRWWLSYSMKLRKCINRRTESIFGDLFRYFQTFSLKKKLFQFYSLLGHAIMCRTKRMHPIQEEDTKVTARHQRKNPYLSFLAVGVYQMSAGEKFRVCCHCVCCDHWLLYSRYHHQTWTHPLSRFFTGEETVWYTACDITEHGGQRLEQWTWLVSCHA